VDIDVGGAIFRILNIHISCADTLRNKQRQFRRAIEHFSPDGTTIVCGDFNVTISLEPKHLPHYIVRRISKALPIRDMLQKRAQAIFAQTVAEIGMHDVFHDKVTYPDDDLSLDSILVPEKLVEESEFAVSPNTYGSDHLPLILEFGH